MLQIQLNLQGTGGGFREAFEGREVIYPSEAAPLRIETLDGGMSSGAPSVGLIIELPDGRVVLAQTSARLFLGAAAAIRGKYGDL